MQPTHNDRFVDASPNASALFEGHRDIGYNLKMALADIIDNSITASASSIEVCADVTADEPNIAIVDNGCGMSECELIDAMRLGSKNPRDNRNKNDLGRFGLGLKSASFSQCRRLTVLTKKEGQVSCACWDLDQISVQDNWNLLLKANPENEIYFDRLNSDGTIVIWEKLDRLTDGIKENAEKRIKHINAQLSDAERHLRLIFHNFLEGNNAQISILLNGRQLKPIDPFASSHPSCQIDPVEKLNLEKGTVKICCYTLPHHKKVSKEEWEELGGPEGHMKSQGFYIYRENRLIIAGGWLGITKQTELTKLCRIRIDIPNSMDSEWKINVNKSSAQLPPLVREKLKKIVERFTSTSKRTYRGRGQILVDDTKFPMWKKIQQDGQIFFKPNIDHPVLVNFSNLLPDDLKSNFEQCMRLLGSNLPIETLHADLLGNAESVGVEKMNEDDIKKLVYSLVDVLLANGTKKSKIGETLKSHTRLRENWNLVEPMIEKCIKEIENE